MPTEIAPASAARTRCAQGLRPSACREPCTMVICGATGDLTERKLGPALYNLLLGGFLPAEFTRRRLCAARAERRGSSASTCARGSTSSAATARRSESIWELVRRRASTTTAAISTTRQRTSQLGEAPGPHRPRSRHRAATASSTWPCRRASTPRSSSAMPRPAWRRSAADGAKAAGRASSSRSRSATTSTRARR